MRIPKVVGAGRFVGLLQRLQPPAPREPQRPRDPGAGFWEKAGQRSLGIKNGVAPDQAQELGTRAAPGAEHVTPCFQSSIRTNPDAFGLP